MATPLPWHVRCACVIHKRNFTVPSACNRSNADVAHFPKNDAVKCIFDGLRVCCMLRLAFAPRKCAASVVGA